jgi:hypothetical protein
LEQVLRVLAVKSLFLELNIVNMRVLQDMSLLSVGRQSRLTPLHYEILTWSLIVSADPRMRITELLEQVGNWAGDLVLSSSRECFSISFTIIGRASSVGLATRYGLNGPGIESRWGRDFPHPSRPALGPHSLLYSENRVFPRGKAAGGVALTTHPPSSAEVKESVELYLYSPSGPSRPVLRRTLPFLPLTDGPG